MFLIKKWGIVEEISKKIANLTSESYSYYNVEITSNNDDLHMVYYGCERKTHEFVFALRRVIYI